MLISFRIFFNLCVLIFYCEIINKWKFKCYMYIFNFSSLIWKENEYPVYETWYTICELRKKIRTRTRARTLARVRCACEIRFELCVRCVCVRGLYGTCELRSQLRNFFFIRRDIVTEFVVPFFSRSKVVIKWQLFVIKMGIERRVLSF